MMVAMLLEDMLEDMGHHLVGPAYRLETGIDLAAREQIDLAILDINLAGKPSFPIAELLATRGVPIIFATGYGANGLGGRFAEAPVISKPFSAASLTQAIDAAL